MKRILIIGFGTQGKRITEAALNCESVLIDIMSHENDFNDGNYGHKVNCTNLNILKPNKFRRNYDFVYLGVGAKNQVKILKKFFEYSFSPICILEKNLTQNLKDLTYLRGTFISRLYVNMWMRNTKAIKLLKKEAKNIETIKVEVCEGDLLANAIHYLDFIQEISNSKIMNLRFKPYSNFYPAKRNYAKEINGSFHGRLERGEFVEVKTTSDYNETANIEIYLKNTSTILLNDSLTTKTLNGREFKLESEYITSKNFSRIIENLLWKDKSQLPLVSEIIPIQYKLMKSLMGSLSIIKRVPLA